MSFSNITLYIKRAEIFHTSEYIQEVLRDMQYGEVEHVKLIKKINATSGQEYHGAIITFKYWFNSYNVQKLLTQLQNSADGTARIVHDYATQRFWLVCQYKSNLEPAITNVSSDLSDKVRIEELEKLVQSMSAQMEFFQKQLEKNEQKFMDYEHKEIHSALINAELRSHLQDSEIKTSFVNSDYKEELTKANFKIAELTHRVEVVKFELEEKKIECEELKQELNDEKNILAYVHEQANEMRLMLHIDLKPLKGKMTIEELID